MQTLHFTHCINTPSQWDSPVAQPPTMHAFWFLGMGVNIVGCPICSMDITTLGTHHLAVEPCSLFPYTLQLPTFIVWGLAGIAATPHLAPVYWQLGPLPNYN